MFETLVHYNNLIYGEKERDREREGGGMMLVLGKQSAIIVVFKYIYSEGKRYCHK